MQQRGTVEQGTRPSIDVGRPRREQGVDVVAASGVPQLWQEDPQGGEAVSGSAQLVHDPGVPDVGRQVGTRAAGDRPAR